jgi:hypothetical protein
MCNGVEGVCAITGKQKDSHLSPPAASPKLVPQQLGCSHGNAEQSQSPGLPSATADRQHMTSNQQVCNSLALKRWTPTKLPPVALNSLAYRMQAITHSRCSTAMTSMDHQRQKLQHPNKQNVKAAQR